MDNDALFAACERLERAERAGRVRHAVSGAQVEALAVAQGTAARTYRLGEPGTYRLGRAFRGQRGSKALHRAVAEREVLLAFVYVDGAGRRAARAVDRAGVSYELG